MPPTKNNLQVTIAEVSALLENDPTVSPALRALIKVLIGFIVALSGKLNLDSHNSSKPPATDPNRKKTRKRNKTQRNPGGQPGHKGQTLEPIDDPDEIQIIEIDRRSLPRGRRYHHLDPIRRQVFDIEVRRVVTEYQAEVLEDDLGNLHVAPFPHGVEHRVQYGTNVKVHAVYLSQYQLLPYKRIQEYFTDQFNLPISTGTLVNFNRTVFDKLHSWDDKIRQYLLASPCLHGDETGININGKRVWLHVCSSAKLTYFMHHLKRGTEAMKEMGILAVFTGVLCHDHWKSYYTVAINALHSLCNAHHERELIWSHEEDSMAWAGHMYELLNNLNKEVIQTGGILPVERQKAVRLQYRKILDDAEPHCPPPDERSRKPKQRGRLKRSKSRNLLERLREYEDDVLRFMTNVDVPYTNNQGENDIRMTKVQQKISGCFRCNEGAKMFCRIRGYISTCRKNGVSATDAIRLALDDNLPEFDMAE